MPHSIPRLFVLRRDRDITGVSGAGDVADGVQWADGSVVLRWRQMPSTSVWDNLAMMLRVHGHDGATRVVWADEDTREQMTRAQAAAGRAYKLADRWETAHGSAMFLVRAAGAELREVLDSADEPTRCAEHDGPCFPDPEVKCPAHGDQQCALCHRNASNCVDSDGPCGFWTGTGMHWDTCPNRVRGPLATRATS